MGGAPLPQLWPRPPPIPHSAQALAPASDPPRYTFAPSTSLNKTARPFGAPLLADSTPQQNGQPLRPQVPGNSKQRLMEDTEDWWPRPRTGQSHSFCILAHFPGSSSCKTQMRSTCRKQGKSMSWSCRAHAAPASGTGTTSALPTCSTHSHSPALAGQLSSLPLSLSLLPRAPLVPPAFASLAHLFSAPGLSLLLAWPGCPPGTGPSFIGHCLPSLPSGTTVHQVYAGLGMEINTPSSFQIKNNNNKTTSNSEFKKYHNIMEHGL